MKPGKLVSTFGTPIPVHFPRENSWNSALVTFRGKCTSEEAMDCIIYVFSRCGSGDILLATAPPKTTAFCGVLSTVSRNFPCFAYHCEKIMSLVCFQAGIPGVLAGKREKCCEPFSSGKQLELGMGRFFGRILASCGTIDCVPGSWAASIIQAGMIGSPQMIRLRAGSPNRDVFR